MGVGHVYSTDGGQNPCTYKVSQKQKNINVTSQFNPLNTPQSYKTY